MCKRRTNRVLGCIPAAPAAPQTGLTQATHSWVQALTGVPVVCQLAGVAQVAQDGGALWKAEAAVLQARPKPKPKCWKWRMQVN